MAVTSKLREQESRHMTSVAASLADLLSAEVEADDAAKRKRLTDTTRAEQAVAWASARDREVAEAAKSAARDMKTLSRAADARERERRRIAADVKERLRGVQRRAGGRALGGTLEPKDVRAILNAASLMQRRMRHRKASLDTMRDDRERNLEAREVFRQTSRAAAFEEACAFGELGLHRAAMSSATALAEAQLSAEMAREREHAESLAHLLGRAADFLTECGESLVVRDGIDELALEQAIAIADAARAGVAADRVRARRVDAARAASHEIASCARANAERAATALMHERAAAAARMEELEHTNIKLGKSVAAAKEKMKRAQVRQEDAEALAIELQHRCSKIASQRGAAAFFEIAKLASVPHVQGMEVAAPKGRPVDSASSTPPAPTPPTATPPKQRGRQVPGVLRAPIVARQDSSYHFSHAHRRLRCDGAPLVNVADAEAIVKPSPLPSQPQAHLHDGRGETLERLHLAREQLGGMRHKVHHLRREVEEMQETFGVDIARASSHIESALASARALASDAVAASARADVSAAAHVTLRRAPVTWALVRPMLSSDLEYGGSAAPRVVAHGGFGGSITVAGVPGCCIFDRVACAGSQLDLAGYNGMAALTTDATPLAAHALAGGKSTIWLAGTPRGGATTTAVSGFGDGGAFMLAARVLAAEAESARRTAMLAASVGAVDAAESNALRFAVSLVEVDAVGTASDALTIQAAAAHAEWRMRSSMSEARALLSDEGASKFDAAVAAEAPELRQLRLLADAVGSSELCFTDEHGIACFACSDAGDLVAYTEAAALARSRAAERARAGGAPVRRHFVLQLRTWRHNMSQTGVLSVVDSSRLGCLVPRMVGDGLIVDTAEAEREADAVALARAAAADAPGASLVLCHVAAGDDEEAAREMLARWACA